MEAQLNKKNIILIGGGGHCKSVIDVIELTQKFNILGIIDKEEFIGKEILNYKVIGSDNDILKLAEITDYFFITIGHIKTYKPREKILEFLNKNKLEMPVIISPLAYVSKNSEINQGTIIHHFAMVNSGVVIKENCIINSYALLEHDSYIDKNTHISTRATVNGEAKIGSNTYLGSSSTVNLRVKIGNNCIIGSSTLVHKDVPDNKFLYGNPFKIIEK